MTVHKVISFAKTRDKFLLIFLYQKVSGDPNIESQTQSRKHILFSILKNT